MRRLGPKYIISQLAAKYNLPPITIVRGRDLPGRTKAFVVIGHKTFPIRETSNSHLTKTRIGPKNAFNAAFIYNLINSDGASLEEKVLFAAKKALNVWNQYNN